MRLFEILGGWSSSMTDLRPKLFVGVRAHHHAARAERWLRLLPTVPHLRPEDLVAPTSQEAADLLSSVDAWAPDDSFAAMAALYRLVLPQLMAAYSAEMEGASPLAEGPTIRVLGQLLLDFGEEISEGATVALALEADLDDEAAGRSAALLADVAVALERAGGLFPRH